MAFLRSYSEQGDPGQSRMRDGQLKRRGFRPIANRSQLVKQRANLAALRRAYGMAGDPFKLRMPKFVRKLTFKKVGSAIARAAKVALPIALPFVGGPIGMLAGAVLGGGGMASAGSPDNPAPELTYLPPQVGTVGEATRGGFSGYEIPGVEVRASRLPARYREAAEDAAEAEAFYDEDDYSDVDDAGEEFYDDEEE